MHILFSLYSYSALLGASTSSKAKTSTASSFGTLIFILLLGVLAYLFFVRPRSQQARRQRETLQEVTPGDEVLTGAGIFGTVLDVEADRITIETAPGTRITVLRSTIARRITEPSEDASEWSDAHEDDHSGTTGSAGSAAQLTNGHDPDDTDEDHTWDEHSDHTGAERDDHDEDSDDPDLESQKKRKRGGGAAAGGEPSSR